ncbi:MAG: cytochrome c biogenesis protein CcdA [Thermocrispum sp.]
MVLRDGAWRVGLLGAGLVAVGLAGYVGYLVYPRFDLPAAEGTGLLALAAAAGFAAFFSPCSFSLLAALLGRTASPDAPRGERVARALGFGMALSLGATVFVVGVGLLIALGGSGVAASITFDSAAGRTLRIAVGLVLVLLGLVQMGRLTANLRPAEPAIHRFLGRQAALRRRRPLLGYTLFGFGYLAAGFG